MSSDSRTLADRRGSRLAAAKKFKQPSPGQGSETRCAASSVYMRVAFLLVGERWAMGSDPCTYVDLTHRQPEGHLRS